MAIRLRPKTGESAEYCSRKPLVVGFTGAVKTGKTTMVETLAGHFRLKGVRVSVVRDSARDIFRLYGAGKPLALEDLPEDPVRYLCFQKDVQELQLAREQRARDGGAELVICDRTVVDTLISTLINTRLTDGYQAFETVVERTWQYLLHDPYDLLFLLPSPQDDTQGNRFLAIQDRLLRTLISLALPKLCMIKTRDFEERFGYIAYLVGECLAKGMIQHVAEVL